MPSSFTFSSLRIPVRSEPEGVRSRPAVLRALGANDPPMDVEIAGETFQLEEVLKHDSWAATGIYASSTRQALCKFNRQQPIFGLPMRWLGRLLATREAGFMERLAGIEGIPRSLGPISSNGELLDHAVSRQWIPGHALAPRERVNSAFFPTFRHLLAAVHARDVAHVDLHKRENILVDDQGRPWLIDFQISFALPRKSRFAATVLRGVLKMLQRCDEYHLLKHVISHRPGQAGMTLADLEGRRPWWIKAHRRVAVPFRCVRRRLLVTLGIRSAEGQASSEAFPEVAHRLPQAIVPAEREAG